MLPFHPELFRLASEEQRRRLLAEAAHWRLRKALQTDLPQPDGRVLSTLRQQLATAWRWLTHPPANKWTAS